MTFPRGLTFMVSKKFIVIESFYGMYWFILKANSIDNILLKHMVSWHM